MNDAQVLIVALPGEAVSLKRALAEEHVIADIASDDEQAILLLNEGGYRVVLIALVIREQRGCGELLWKTVKTRWPELEIILLSPGPSEPSEEGIRQCFYWLQWPSSPLFGIPDAYPLATRLVQLALQQSALQQENRELKAALARASEQSASVEAVSENRLEEPVLPLVDVERQHIDKMLRRTNGNKALAAKLLGIDPTTLWRKLRRHD